MVLSNQTTIETSQKHVYRIDGDRASSNNLNLFDVGKKRNWIQVMGEPWYLWFLPISNTPGDGKAWPLSSGRYSALESYPSGARLSPA
ncbi:MAG: hypothetical protein BJ554DRAFT_8197 [Olpidium bornovanus]|uniref:Uncharacterized protein n=1 Tax=Olpidium bornovanus TaxID=278681 RepID=A0A8H8DIH4_9FUNG|nr:MAG: hypothetical protein BJ554DRAFT_8197 [Olpidium bornovanus]